MRRLRSRQRIPGVDRRRPQSLATSIAELVGQLEPVWPGAPIEESVLELAAPMEAGAVVIGGYTYYKDDIRRARTLRTAGCHRHVV